MRFPHGLVFHHFHDAFHPAGQGSLSGNDFEGLLDYIGLDNILSADEWFDRALHGKLTSTDKCITFDDNLRCQFDIALPVLNKLKKTAFWFVYTSPLHGKIEKLELYRYFRSTMFSSANNFYERFYDYLANTPWKSRATRKLKEIDLARYLANKPFYSLEDRKFRYIRNNILTTEEYDKIMGQMIEDAGLDEAAVSKKLWMDRKCLRTLKDTGHIVGLHSHSHPTDIKTLSLKQQHQEYSTNLDTLRACLGQEPETISYPFGEYNADTISIMNELGIKLGFRADMEGPAQSLLEFPRVNHSTILMEM